MLTSLPLLYPTARPLGQLIHDLGYGLVKHAAEPETHPGLSGRFYVSKSGWGLLHVPNDLIRGAFMALNEPGIELPPDFNAHVSVFRKEEISELGGADRIKERGQVFRYSLGRIKTVKPAGWNEFSKVWYFTVHSPELETLRKSYGLSPLPKYPLHITIAVRRPRVLQNNTVRVDHAGKAENDDGQAGETRSGKDAGVSQLEGNEGAVLQPGACKLSTLRSQGDSRLSEVAHVLELLCRHGTTSGGDAVGAEEKRSGLQLAKLLLGDEETAGEEQAKQSSDNLSWRNQDASGVGGTDGLALGYDLVADRPGQMECGGGSDFAGGHSSEVAKTADADVWGPNAVDYCLGQGAWYLAHDDLGPFASWDVSGGGFHDGQSEFDDDFVPRRNKVSEELGGTPWDNRELYIATTTCGMVCKKGSDSGCPASETPEEIRGWDNVEQGGSYEEYVEDDLDPGYDPDYPDEKSAADFAPGLPRKRWYGKHTDIPEDELATMVAQLHLARRAGRHTDLRIGDPKGMYSWAVRHGFPQPGSSGALAVRTGMHRYGYKDFEGEIACVPGTALVTCSDGVCPIESLQPQCNEVRVLGVGSRGLAFYPVKRLYRDVRRSRWVRLDFDEPVGKTSSLVCGPEHKIYLVGKGFISAEDVEVGDTVVSQNTTDSSIELGVASGTHEHGIGWMVCFANHVWDKMVSVQVVSFTAGATDTVPLVDNSFSFLPTVPFPIPQESGLNSPAQFSRSTNRHEPESLECLLSSLTTDSESISYFLDRQAFSKIPICEQCLIVEARHGGFPSAACEFVSSVGQVSTDDLAILLSIEKTEQSTSDRIFCSKPDDLRDLVECFPVIPEQFNKVGVLNVVAGPGHVFDHGGFLTYQVGKLDVPSIVRQASVICKHVFYSEMEAFDLSVEDSNNYFVDGVLTHNSGNYGAGSVRKLQEQPVLVTKVTPNAIQFTTAGTKHQERFVLVKPKGWKDESWLLLNRTPTEGPGVSKLRYKKIPAKDLEAALERMQDGDSLEAKVGGASTILHILKDGVEAFSYRRSAKTGRPIVYTEKLFGGKLPKGLKIPPELVGTLLKGEIYGQRDQAPAVLGHDQPEDDVGDGGLGEDETSPGGPDRRNVIPDAELGGILNATLAEAIRKQREQQVRLKTMLFDVARYGDKDVDPSEVPRADRRKMLEQVLQHLPQDAFHLSEAASDKQQAKALWDRIRGGKHELTNEGAVYYPRTGIPIKSKLMDDYDVHVSGVFPGEGKYKDQAAGGFEYSTEPGGPVAGRVGTGLSDELRQQLWADPDSFIGRVAKVQAQEQFPSGALRAPAFKDWHLDKGQA